MGCICPKAASADEVPETPKAKASSKAQIRHFNGSARIETMDALNHFLVEKDREKPKPRSKQNDGRQDSMDKRRRHYAHAVLDPRLGNVPEQIQGEQVAAGWPSWFTAVAGEAIKGWIPRRADSFEKLDKIGQGTYSNVYKARDLSSGKIVALKKVRFDSSEPESVKFMAREIQIIRRLDHPNVVKLEGLVTSRMSSSLYLVFEYMEHDLAGLAACPGIMFTEPQVKCYLQQLLRGLDHCHTRGILHRDIKGSNLLIDNDGLLKIADFGLATFYDPSHKVPMTSRVVTLWYRPPELLLGATDYGVGVDLWSTGCILAELLTGKPIMPGHTEIEQVHRIFKLCGTPPESYWKRLKLPPVTLFRPNYKRSLAETFKDLPPTALALLETLLAIEPSDRGLASAALKSEFFTTKPYPCDPKLLPKYPPSKEFDAKVRDEEARRHKAARQGAADPRRHGSRERSRSAAVPDANAELPISLQRRRVHHQASTKSKSEKFPSASDKTATGFPMEPPPSRQGRLATDIRASSPVPHRRLAPPPSSRSGPLDAAANAIWTKKDREDDVRMAPARSMRVTTDSRHWQAGKREGEGDFTLQLRNSLRAEQQRKKPELDSRRSDVLYGSMTQQQLTNVPEPQLTSKAGYDERMYFSGPLLRPGLPLPAVDIEELLEEHGRKLEQAVRRANQEKPSSNSSGKHD